MLWSRKGDEEMNRILIAEDDASIANLIRTVLVDAGYRCTWAPDGEQAADLLEKESFDLALLDIMLPGVNGYDLLEYCKSLEVPVIFLTALGGVEDRVRGLRSGAEDYLPKPFALPELLARVETVLRRCHKTEQFLTEGDLVIDTASRTVKKNGTMVNLTNKEYELLLLFLRNKNRALYRETIYESVWGGEYTGTGRTVDLHVQRLKKKLRLEEHIRTIYKVGYRLEC